MERLKKGLLSKLIIGDNMKNLTEEEIVLLDCLIYWQDLPEFRDGVSVSEIVKEGKYHLENGGVVEKSLMSEKDWLKVFTAIENSPNLMNYQMVSFRDAGTPIEDPSQIQIKDNMKLLDGNLKNYPMRVAAFTDDMNNPTDTNVIFRGTSNSLEWQDNSLISYEEKETFVQAVSEFYVNNVIDEKYGNNLTASGHSKGGNDAYHVTLVTDRIARAISVDGPGASEEYHQYYADEILLKQDRLKGIHGDKDYVNPLFGSLSNNNIYIETAKQDSFDQYHDPSLLIDANGKFYNETDQDTLSKWINMVTMHLDNDMDTEQTQFVVDNFLIGIIDDVMGNSENKKGIGELLYEDSTDAYLSIVKIIEGTDIVYETAEFVKKQKYEEIKEDHGEFAAFMFNLFVSSPLSKMSSMLNDVIENAILKVSFVAWALVEGHKIIKNISEGVVELYVLGKQKVQQGILRLEQKIEQGLAHIEKKAIEAIRNFEREVIKATKYFNIAISIGRTTIKIINQKIVAKLIFFKNIKDKIISLILNQHGKAVATPYINLNTNSLRSYADRLAKVKSRLAELDSDMTSLIFSESLPAVISAIRANNFPSQRKIQKCINYLDGTAEAFEKAEKNILSQV